MPRVIDCRLSTIWPKCMVSTATPFDGPCHRLAKWGSFDQQRAAALLLKSLQWTWYWANAHVTTTVWRKPVSKAGCNCCRLAASAQMQALRKPCSYALAARCCTWWFWAMVVGNPCMSAIAIFRCPDLLALMCTCKKPALSRRALRGLGWPTTRGNKAEFRPACRAPTWPVICPRPQPDPFYK